LKGKHLNKNIRFKKLYNDWGEALFRFIYNKTGDPALSEDLVQDLFVKVWEKLEDIKEDQAKNYLFTMARNSLINRAHHEKVVDKYTSQLKVVRNIETPAYQLEYSEYQMKVQAAIDSLSEGQKEVFLLSRIEGLRYREIAALLGISQKAVEKRMHLALLHLKDKLQKKL
jgi:RNA polymerase sigma-70 factor (family 1)